jgi:hypothetical protein
MGDGVSRPYGLQLCTDSYSLPDVVRLMNVLIIRYELGCTLHKKRENQYRIYISSKSMSRLKEIVGPSKIYIIYIFSFILYINGCMSQCLINCLMGFNIRECKVYF